MSETEETASEPRGGGALLRQVREESGVHVAALAVALKVPVRQIEALEQDRLDLLPDHTFARALAGSICRHLRADARPILERLPQGTPRTVKVGEGLNEPFRTSSAPGSFTLRERLMRPPVLVALALLVAALLLFVLPIFGEPEPEAEREGNAATSPAVSEPAPVPANPAVAKASDKVVIEPVTPLRPPEAPAAVTPAPTPAPAAPTAPRTP